MPISRIEVYPQERDMYQDRTAKTVNADAVYEFHLDAGGSVGHIIKHVNVPTTETMAKLNNVVASNFGSRGIVGRDDLYNLNTFYKRGIDYNLIEVFPITNLEDLNNYNSKMDTIAKQFAEVIYHSRNGGTVLLDAGHGGGDPGAVANGTSENNEMPKLVERIWMYITNWLNEAQPQPQPQPTPQGEYWVKHESTSGTFYFDKICQIYNTLDDCLASRHVDTYNPAIPKERSVYFVEKHTSNLYVYAGYISSETGRMRYVVIGKNGGESFGKFS